MNWLKQAEEVVVTEISESGEKNKATGAKRMKFFGNDRAQVIEPPLSEKAGRAEVEPL